MTKKRELLFSVTIHDCEVQTFRAGGKGGQHANKTSSGVRIIHHPSGARGECREERSQLQNKKRAFERMAKSTAFNVWVQDRARGLKSVDLVVEEQMEPHNLKVEQKVGKKWEPLDE